MRVCAHTYRTDVTQKKTRKQTPIVSVSVTEKGEVTDSRGKTTATDGAKIVTDIVTETDTGTDKDTDTDTEKRAYEQERNNILT